MAYAFCGLIPSLLQFFGYFWPKHCINEGNSPKSCISQIAVMKKNLPKIELAKYLPYAIFRLCQFSQETKVA